MRHYDQEFFTRLARRLGIALLIGTTLVAASYMIYPEFCTPSAPSANTTRNGMWMRYLYYFGKKDDGEIRELSSKLNHNQIHYAYFHVYDVTPEGNLRFAKLHEAQNLVDIVHRHAPGTKVMAWISAGDWYPAHGTHMDQPGVIANMGQAAGWLVNDCGFDGVQWDYEPPQVNSKQYLAMLDATRHAMPFGKILSVTAPIFYPEKKIGWSIDYFAEVAKRCDQIAVMGYDTVCKSPWSYAGLIGEQCTSLTGVIGKANPMCRLVIGVPTYDKKTDPLHNMVETLRLALVGVRDGMAKPQTDKRIFDGVAIFADYTTDENEWRTYRQVWLGRPD